MHVIVHRIDVVVVLDVMLRRGIWTMGGVLEGEMAN